MYSMTVSKHESMYQYLRNKNDFNFLGNIFLCDGTYKKVVFLMLCFNAFNCLVFKTFQIKILN